MNNLMTETTKDIADLREVAGIGETSDWMTWPKVDPAKLKRVLDQFEAERQRADSNDPVRCEGVPQHVHDMIDLQETIDELQAELAALKGEQVPMFLKQTGIGFNGCQGSYKEYVTIDEGEYDGNPVKHLKLFTAPQKLVVLPMPFDINVAGERVDWKGGDYYDRDDVLAAIEAAGGIVKDGE